MMMHLLSRDIVRSRHDLFSYAIMMCDPKGGGMGTDYPERVDCPECLELMKETEKREEGANHE